MKSLSTFLIISVLLGIFSLQSARDFFTSHVLTSKSDQAEGYYSVTAESNVTNIVAKAEAFKALLSSAQIDTLQQTFTTTLAQNWSNLPCGSQCRNGIEFSSLNTAQFEAAKELIAAAAGTAANEGYDEFFQIVTADSILNVHASASGGTGGGPGGGPGGGGASSSYSKEYYFISFLNEPTTTGAWMLQFGGHHYAANIAFNGGLVVGATPRFEGIEPKFYHLFSSTTQDSVLVAPLYQEQAAMVNMLTSLSTAELETAKITSQTFSDVVLGPDQDGNFPTTKVGQLVGSLTTAQKALVTAAIEPWIQDADDATADSFRTIYANELDSTYISYSGSTALNTNTNYVRIDGPSVWIEFVCQSGVVFSDSIHYHSIWRDHKRDYGNYLAATALPVNLLSFTGSVQGSSRLLSWTTANEVNTSSFSLERSLNPSQGFVSVGQVSAKNGTSNSYTFTDKAPLGNGTYFYRLKIIDRDGTGKYSQNVPLTISTTKNIAIYPNPTVNKITISSVEGFSNATIKIINNAGKIVLVNSGKTGNVVTVDAAKLTAGTYIVQIVDKGVTSTYKIIKQNK